MNEGFDMKEVAERFEFPPELAHEWFNRGYYGATVFNVKAVYQKYLGWFDNNPVSLWQLPDKISAAFYAKYLPQSGGSLVQAAQLAYDEGHYRWVVEVLDHVRLAPNAWDQSVYNAALDLQADAFEQMAYSAESGIWRNYFLAGAWRNRDENIRDFLETPVAMSSVNARQIPGAHSARAAGSSKPPTEFTKRENAKYKGAPLDYSDTRDIGLIERGFIARVAKNATEPLLITKADGTVVWDMGRYSYISGDISKPEQFPDTVNPSLWRQAILNTHYGLYEIVSRDFGGEARSIYQVRGYDVANMSFIETPNGFIVVDALTNEEAAAAAVELLYDNLPENKKDKTIHTVIYTHSHTDHYGGIQGVLKSGKMRDGYEIAAPEGFWEAAVSENETVGPAMLSRAKWMYGQALWMIDIPDGRGQVNNGLAISTSFGTNELKAPTQVIAGDGARQFDGTNVEFILTPDTEAPAEMVMLFTDYNSICLAEICNQTQHNILTPRGAQVRDTLAWSGTLDKMKREWVDTGRADSAWGPHNWPRWGKDAVGEYIDKQSRLYRFLHDQTVVLMNEGYDMKEIAERFELPPELAEEWFNRGYYGATVFNVKAVHQKYLGWFDNNPVSLWKLPDKISAEFYAKYLPQSGGNLVQAAQAAYADGNYRWVAEVLDHVCLAPGNWDQSVYNAALELQADAFEQMAYSAESGIWRNYFLTGAWRNRDEEFRKLIDDGDDGGGNTGGDGGCQTGLGLGALLLIAALIFPRLKKTK
jgi:alkyl sulfatase BDS1-like metallo-beta-lactamase superfamily hydrolase